MTSAQALYSRLWVQAPSLGALGLGAFVAVVLGGQARAGLAHVKNKRNQRWIEPSGGTDGTEFYNVFLKDLFIALLEL